MRVKRWAKLQPWSPTSSAQVLEYLKSKGYQIYLNRKTKRPTSNSEALEQTLRKHPEDPIIPIVLACRDLQKADGYLSDKYVGRDGRFHPEYGRHPKTLRYSSRAPSVMNLPKPEKHKESKDPRRQAKALIAEAVISSIEASPGFTLIERDYKGQESLLLGYFAQDAQYMRLARLGIYAYFMSKKKGIEIDLSLPDAVVKKQLSAVKNSDLVEYALFKKTILARGYGEGVPAIARDLEPYFLDEAKERAAESGSKRKDIVFEICSKLAREAAEEYVRIYEAYAPKVVEFQQSVRLRAHKEKKLTNPFSYTLAFFDVMKPRRRTDGSYVYDSKGKLVGSPGAEWNEAVAYLPQSTGAGILTETLLELDRRLGQDPDFHILLPEHDKVLAECREGTEEHYQAIMREIMEAPIPVLGGLTIETEGKRGKNWGKMEDCA